MRCSTRSERIVWATAGLLLVLSTPPVSAQVAPLEPTARERAAELTRRATTLYKAGQFDEALIQYERAYEAYPVPALLFNMGQCHKNLGSDERAIFFFSNYLRDQPDAANREVVEELIGEARARVGAEEAREAASRPRPSLEHRSEDPLYRKWWLWAAVGAALATGAAVYAVSASDDDPSVSLGRADWR